MQKSYKLFTRNREQCREFRRIRSRTDCKNLFLLSLIKASFPVLRGLSKWCPRDGPCSNLPMAPLVRRSTSGVFFCLRLACLLLIVILIAIVIKDIGMAASEGYWGTGKGHGAWGWKSRGATSPMRPFGLATDNQQTATPSAVGRGVRTCGTSCTDWRMPGRRW